jgi:hypothetical protein
MENMNGTTVTIRAAATLVSSIISNYIDKAN